MAAGQRHRGFGLPVLVHGESGTGKLAVLRAMFAASGRSGPVTVCDAALLALDPPPVYLGQVRAALGRPDGLVVLRHVELLDERTARAVAALLDAVVLGSGPAVGGTLVGTAGPGALHLALLDRLGATTIGVPPLRARPEDVAELVLATTARLGLSCTWRPTVLATLAAGEWRGNVRRLVNVVAAACLARPAGEIGPEDLPDEELDLAGFGCRGTLTRMEEAQRTTILTGLRDAEGNKAEAAARLGISRSTLYRKLRAYGIDADRSPPG